MPTVAKFLQDLRAANLNDESGRRFPDRRLLPYFKAALNTMYRENLPAFHGLYTEADIVRFGNMTDEQALLVNVEDILAVSAHTDFLNRIWTKTSSASQRGQALGNALSADEEVRDRGRTPRQR